MPGGRLATVRVGDHAELLANYMLEHLAFVTRVPREEDVGIDMICALIEPSQMILKAGHVFTTQVKSTCNPVVYKTPHAIDWIVNQDNPFFLAVADATMHKLELYSTWRMLNAFLLYTPPRVRLVPGNQKKGDYIYYTRQRTRVDIYLGDPIITLNLSDLADATILKQRAEVLKECILIDKLNIARRGAKLYWVEGPKKHTTNVKLPARKSQNQDNRFYWNPKNVNATLDNYVRANIALINELRDLDKQNQLPPALKIFLQSVISFLQTSGKCLHPVHKRWFKAISKLKIT